MATETTALAILETCTAVQIFEPGFIDPVIERIEAEARSEAARLDISTEANRKQLASLAYKVARSKTFIDGQRLALVADEKKRLKRIDEEGRRIWDRLERLQEDVRKPLTEWEEAEKSRVACHEEALNILTGLSVLPGLCSVADAEERIEKANNLHAQRNWEEFASRAAGVKAATLFALGKSLEQAQKAEAEQAELKRLRAEAAERDRKDREERIARDATEKATRDAEIQRLKIEDDKRAAEARAAESERSRIAEQREASERAARAAEQAERDKQAAIKAERDRAAAKAQREKEEQERREASARIRKRVLGEISKAIEAHGVPTETAEAIAFSLGNSQMPHVTVVF